MFKKLLFIFLTSLIFLFSSNIKALTFSNDIKMKKSDAYFDYKKDNSIIKFLKGIGKQEYNRDTYFFEFNGSKIAYLKKCDKDNKYLSAWTGLEKVSYLLNYQLGQKISSARADGTMWVNCSIHEYSYGKQNKQILERNIKDISRFIKKNYGENELIKLYDHILSKLNSDYFETREINFYKDYFNELKQNISDKTDNKNKKDEIKDEETNTLNKSEKKPKTKVDDKLTISLEEAKSILTLVQQFLPSNPSEFDVVALTTLIQKNKEVLQDSWSNQQQDNFKELYDFLFQSDAFSNFKITKDKEIQKAKEEAIKQQRVFLDQNVTLLKDYLTQNMFSEDAPQVLEMIAEGESLQSSENIEELKSINIKINSFLNEKNIKGENTQNNSDNSSSSINQKVENVLNIFNGKDNSETDNLNSSDTATIESNKSAISFELSLLVNTAYSGCSDGIVFFDYVFYKDKEFKQVSVCNDGQGAVPNTGVYEIEDGFNQFFIKYLSNGTEVIDKFKKERYGDWDWEVVWNSEIVYESGYGPSPQYYKEADNKEIRDQRKNHEQKRSNIYAEVCERIDTPTLNKDEFLKDHNLILHLKKKGLDRNTHGSYEEELLFNKYKVKKLSYVYSNDQANEGVYDWSIIKKDGDAYYIYFQGEKRNEYNVIKEEDEVYYFEKNRVEKNFCHNLAKEIKQREYEDPEDKWEYSQQYYDREEFDIFRSPESYLLNWDRYTFQPTLVKDFIPEELLERKNKEKENKLNAEINESKGGYKNFYFDMNFDQLKNEVLKTCGEQVTNLTSRNLFNDKLDYYYPVDINNLQMNCIEFAGKKRPTYFYLNSNNKIKIIKIELDELPNQFVSYLMNNSGVLRYDEIVKMYKNSDKYETYRYPTKFEIEDFNNQDLGKMYEDKDSMLKLNTIFRNKKVGNFVIVQLGKTTFDNINFGTFIVIEHYSIEETENYLGEEKSNEIKSDDL